MKEKEKNKLLSSSVENQWLVNQIELYKDSLNEIKFTCNWTYVDWDTKKTYLIETKRNELIGKLFQIRSFISVIDTKSENTLKKEIEALNTYLKENLDQLETILLDEEVSQDVRDFSNKCLEKMESLQKRIVSSNMVTIGPEIFFIDEIKKGEEEYCINVKAAIIGFLEGHIHKLRPKQVPHA